MAENAFDKISRGLDESLLIARGEAKPAKMHVKIMNQNITVTFEQRPDGGLRAYSDDIPGLVLSNIDPEKVFDDVIPAIEFILSEVRRIDSERV